MHPFLLLTLLCAAVIGHPLTAAGTSSPQATAPFVAAYRSGIEAWLLTDTGVVFSQTGSAAPVMQYALRGADGHPPHWKGTPSGLARYRGQWIVADGSTALSVFGANGMFLHAVSLPTRSFDVFASGDRLFVYDALPDAAPNRLWFTTNLTTFAPLAVQFVDTRLPERARMLAAQVIFAPSGDGGLFFIHGIGEPVAVRVAPTGGVTEFPLAYSRSRARASLTVAGAETDLPAYSAPARDALWTPAHELFVIRNREDVPSPAGLTMQQGRRIDRYDATGHLAGTATVPLTARWLLRGDARSVTVLAVDGSVHVVAVGGPQPGAIH